MKLSEATKGRRVVYIPNHAAGDRFHPHCRHGCVKRPADNGLGAFVLYDNLETRMTTGDEDYTAQLTSLTDLILE